MATGIIYVTLVTPNESKHIMYRCGNVLLQPGVAMYVATCSLFQAIFCLLLFQLEPTDGCYKFVGCCVVERVCVMMQY